MTNPLTNRAARRAAARNRRIEAAKARPIITPQYVVQGARKLDAHTRCTLTSRAERYLAALLAQPTPEAWQNVACMHNLAEQMCLMGLASNLTGLLDDGNRALSELHDSLSRGEPGTPTEQQAHALRDLAFLYTLQLDYVSVLEYEQAFARARMKEAQALAGNGKPGARILTPSSATSMITPIAKVHATVLAAGGPACEQALATAAQQLCIPIEAVRDAMATLAQAANQSTPAEAAA